MTAGVATLHRDSCTDKMSGSIADRPQEDDLEDLFDFMLKQVKPGGKNNFRWLAGAASFAMSHSSVARNQDIRGIDLSSLHSTKLQAGKPHDMHAVTWTIREGKVCTKTGQPEHTGGGRHQKPKIDMFTHLFSFIFYMFHIQGKGLTRIFTILTSTLCCFGDKGSDLK